MKFRGVEFLTNPQGEVEVRTEGAVFTYLPEHKELTNELFAIIEEDYPEAFAGLTEIYTKSAPNVPWFKYQVVHRFIRCNFGQYDRADDIDFHGRFVFENVDCPLVRECRYHNVVCNPKFNNRLTVRETEVMSLLYEGCDYGDCAARLGISEETVRTIKRNAFRRLGVHTMNEFQIYARENNLFKNK